MDAYNVDLSIDILREPSWLVMGSLISSTYNYYIMPASLDFTMNSGEQGYIYFSFLKCKYFNEARKVCDNGV